MIHQVNFYRIRNDYLTIAAIGMFLYILYSLHNTVWLFAFAIYAIWYLVTCSQRKQCYSDILFYNIAFSLLAFGCMHYVKSGVVADWVSVVDIFLIGCVLCNSVALLYKASVIVVTCPVKKTDSKLDKIVKEALCNFKLYFINRDQKYRDYEKTVANIILANDELVQVKALKILDNLNKEFRNSRKIKEPELDKVKIYIDDLIKEAAC